MLAAQPLKLELSGKVIPCRTSRFVSSQGAASFDPKNKGHFAQLLIVGVHVQKRAYQSKPRISTLTSKPNLLKELLR